MLICFVTSFFAESLLLFFSAHQFEVVNLLQLGEDEFAPHVCHLHLQLVDLQKKEFKIVTYNNLFKDTLSMWLFKKISN